MQWLSQVWHGRVHGAIELAERSACDDAISQTSRDLFTGMAIVDRYSLLADPDHGDPRGLVPAAHDVIGRSTVASARVTCLLGVAWAIHGSRPDDALDLAQSAAADMPNLPLYLRRTLPGNVNRLLASIDPALAAEDLLARISADTAMDSFTDLIPLYYAAELLVRVDHPDGAVCLTSLSHSSLAGSPAGGVLHLDPLSRHVRDGTSGWCLATAGS